MGELIVGPILEDIQRADFSGARGVLATAFYSATPLDAFDVSCRELNLLVRLNRNDFSDWVNGVVDPEALLRFADRQVGRGVKIELRCSPTAHAKIYLGRATLLVGSANFTGRGLWGDGQEVLWREAGRLAIAAASARVNQYAANLQRLSLDELRQLVDKNKGRVADLRRRRKITFASEEIPRSGAARPPRLGDYSDFLSWLRGQGGTAAREIHARAYGKSQLSGHVQNCFYGGRQLLIADPHFRLQLLQRSPESYRVFADRYAESRIREFTKNEIVDEPGFHASVWRNISPIELGGRVERRGGLIGSLNRTLPLLARYLGERGNFP